MSDLIKILSSIKISRNIKEYPFVKLMTKEQKTKLLLDLVGCLQEADYKCERLPFDTLKANQDYFNVLYELPISEDVAVLRIVDGEQAGSYVYAVINNEEHITLYCSILRGEDIWKRYEQISKIEQTIDRSMPFNATIKNGYLCSNLRSTGLGLNLSTTIHAAGIVQSESKDFFKKMEERGYEITFMSPAKGNKLHFMKITSNRQYGISEEDLIKQFGEGIEQFIDIENRQLLKYYNKNKQQIDDTVLKSFGILQFTKSIAMDEAFARLGDVITGLRISLLSYVSENAADDTVGDLLLRILDRDVIGEECQGCEDIHTARANAIKKYLKEIKIAEGLNG